MPAHSPRLAVASGKALMSEALIRIPAAKGIRMSGRRVVSQRASNCAMRGAVVTVTGQEVSFIRDLSDFAGSNGTYVARRLRRQHNFQAQL